MARFSVVLFLVLFSSGTQALKAQAFLMEGKVVDEQNRPLSSIHIQIQDTDIVAVTNDEGLFSMDCSSCGDHETVLIFSHIAYETLQFKADTGTGSKHFLEIRMSPKVYEERTVVVTATRTLRDIEEVSIPVKVVGKEEIERSGSLRLSDILAEQAGMQIVSDHGTGVQVQGFDPDYTLIMIDGNPVIGRTAGTLELDRISVRNIEQIEIVKGPSSALWGSDALAGVVNIITRSGNRPLSGGLTTRYGANNTLDLAGDISFKTDSWANDLFVNRNSSAGYRINPGSIGKTIPEYENYTFSYRTSLNLTERIGANLGIRYFTENQQNLDYIPDDDKEQTLLDYHASREDFVINPKLTFQPADRLDISADMQFSFYKNNMDYTFLDSGERYDTNHFRQYYNKPEIQASYWWRDSHQTLIGSGAIFERLKADRYPDNPSFITQFAFAQHTWMPNQNLEITGGVRYDIHSEYSSQLSPKFSARYNLTDNLQVRASAGSGFKAPEFRQLFLDFTNAASGYSVLGSSTAAAGIQRMQEDGQIAQVLIPADQLSEIKAESSVAFNLGFDFDARDDLRLRINLFRNNVQDLIETAPIARRQNGQAVYSYLNLEEIFTRGIETEVKWSVLTGLELTLGYQLLDARRLIEDERTVQNEEGEVITRTIRSHEPMLNRSKHSGNIKLFYKNETGWGASARGIFRGNYGLFDSNGNGYADEGEYEDGYMVWNGSVSRQLYDRLRIQAGMNNIFDYRNINVPSLPGRIMYAQVSIDF